MRAVVLLSGGMDSTTLAYRLVSNGDDVDFLTFDYGQRHRTREISCAELTAARLVAKQRAAKFKVDVRWNRVDLRSVGALLEGSALTDEIEVPEGHYTEDSMKATVVANRNAIMLSVAVGVAVARKADYVACAVHAGDHAVYPDCRPEFIQHFDSTARVGTEGFSVPGFEVVAPFVHWTKEEIAIEGDRLGVPWGDTWSCYQGGERHCGRCGTCVERAEALSLAGVPDPTDYVDPNFWRTAVEAA